MKITQLLPGQILRPNVRRPDGFGFVRLLLASLVIVSHTPELVDGNRSRELLTRLFGTLSFGELAVDGFFVISGFFITGSFISSPSVGDYLVKRVARIYPGFVVAWLISAFIAVRLAGAAPSSSVLQTLGSLLRLQEPSASGINGAFAGQPYPTINSPMWTIQYEFRCYLVIAAFGLLGLLRWPKFVAFSAAAAFVINSLESEWLYEAIPRHLSFSSLFIGSPAEASRLFGCFFTGACFYLARERISVSGNRATLAVVALFSTMSIAPMAHASFAICGGYLLFYLGRKSAGTIIERINNPTDISYGVYLYAWPIEKLFIWFFPQMPLLALGAITVAASCGAGWISWHIVERWPLAFVRMVSVQSKRPTRIVRTA